MRRRSPVRPLRPACPHGRLLRLLGKLLPPDVQIGTSQPKPWASASFVGARHIFSLNLLLLAEGQPGDRSQVTTLDTAQKNALAARLQQRLADQNWSLSGHIVADCAVTIPDNGDGLTLEILTVED
ncbi:MAG TPA: hypothetical protein VFG34_05295 [Sphingopyxis sp.]|nr:hypothetical protein [Sphingopyxis sp.]